MYNLRLGLLVVVLRLFPGAVYVGSPIWKRISNVYCLLAVLIITSKFSSMLGSRTPGPKIKSKRNTVSQSTNCKSTTRGNHQSILVAPVSSLLCFRKGIRSVPPVPFSFDLSFVDATARFRPPPTDIGIFLDGMMMYLVTI